MNTETMTRDELIAEITRRDASRLEADKQYDALQLIGASAMDSIRDMVAAVECDYDRLAELREERDAYSPEWSVTEVAKTWSEEYPDDAEELAELESAAGDCESREDAETRIQEDPLSLEYRSDWESDRDALTPSEFCLLLSTGGPATRIIGALDANGEPTRARLEAQDWYTPWTEYRLSDEDTLLAYCRVVGIGA